MQLAFFFDQTELVYLIEKCIGMFSLLYEVIGKTQCGEFVCHE